MIQNNLTTPKQPRIRVASGGPLSRLKKMDLVEGKNQDIISEATIVHFRNICRYIESQKNTEHEAERDTKLAGFDSGFQAHGRWSAIEIPIA